MNPRQHLSEQEAYPYIQPYIGLISGLIQDAIDSYKARPVIDRLIDGKRTRSSSISDRIIFNIMHCQELLNDHDILVKPKYGTVRILIKNTIQIVFKKVDDNLLPSYPNTSRSLGFHTQSDDISTEFPGISQVPYMTNVYWGYIWDPLDKARIPIVCTDGSQLFWHIEQVQKKESTTVIEPKETKSDIENKIKPKKDIIRKRKQENDNDKGL